MSRHHVYSLKPRVHINHSLKNEVVVKHAYYHPLLTKVLAQLFFVFNARVVLNFSVYSLFQEEQMVLHHLLVRLLQWYALLHLKPVLTIVV